MVAQATPKILTKLAIAIFLSYAFISGCGDIDYDTLTIARTPYEGNAIRLDGYYYEDLGDGRIDTYFLFRNGIILSSGVAGGGQSLSEWEAMILNGNLDKMAVDKKWYWGAFRINGNKIEYERWVPSYTGNAYRYAGEILNDTTFKITSAERVDGSNRSAVDLVYHFRAFSPKPDSVTSFIP